MANGITAWFNDWFGSNLTHVANAFSKSKEEYIWICIHEKELSIQTMQGAIDVSKNTNASLKISWQNTTGSSLIKIPFGEWHKYMRNNSWDRLTVITHDGELLHSNYKIAANRSFIVKATGGLVGQKYGSGNLFEDDYGVDHTPE